MQTFSSPSAPPVPLSTPAATRGASVDRCYLIRLICAPDTTSDGAALFSALQRCRLDLASTLAARLGVDTAPVALRRHGRDAVAAAVKVEALCLSDAFDFAPVVVRGVSDFAAAMSLPLHRGQLALAVSEVPPRVPIESLLGRG